jgi:hypothetical protein
MKSMKARMKAEVNSELCLLYSTVPVVVAENIKKQAVCRGGVGMGMISS